MKHQTNKRPVITKAQIYRAVASSTAIETGQPVKDIEDRLAKQSAAHSKVKLARVGQGSSR